MAVEDWSTTAASNGAVGAVNIAESCPSANLNNAIREVMAQIAQWRDDLGDDYQAKDALLTALAGLTTAANQIAYSTGPDTFAMTALTAFACTILDDADGSAVCNTIGAVRVAALSLANPGYIRLQVGASSYFQVCFGNFSVTAGEGPQSVTFPAAFPTECVSAIATLKGTGLSNNDIFAQVTAFSPTGMTVYYQAASGGNNGTGAHWLAVGY